MTTKQLNELNRVQEQIYSYGKIEDHEINGWFNVVFYPNAHGKNGTINIEHCIVNEIKEVIRKRLSHLKEQFNNIEIIQK